MPRRIIRLQAVLDKTGWSKSTLRRRELAEEFCRRVQLGENSVGWFEDEVDACLAALPRAPLPKAADEQDNMELRAALPLPLPKAKAKAAALPRDPLKAKAEEEMELGAGP
jgi:predicted DNA-binding transcriptional regulator AlpA